MKYFHAKNSIFILSHILIHNYVTYLQVVFKHLFVITWFYTQTSRYYIVNSEEIICVIYEKIIIIDWLCVDATIQLLGLNIHVKNLNFLGVKQNQGYCPHLWPWAIS